MKIHWELDKDDAMNARRVEHLIRENDDGSYTLLGTARTQKQFNELNKKYLTPKEKGKTK